MGDGGGGELNEKQLWVISKEKISLSHSVYPGHICDLTDMTCLNFAHSCALSRTQEPDFTKLNCYIPEVKHKNAVKIFVFFASAISRFPDATFYVHSILPLTSLPYD